MMITADIIPKESHVQTAERAPVVWVTLIVTVQCNNRLKFWAYPVNLYRFAGV